MLLLQIIEIFTHERSTLIPELQTDYENCLADDPILVFLKLVSLSMNDENIQLGRAERLA